ncbi:VOC family protein [Exilibacterium tricleocarpae]|uniref:VOC family protein n=1 Tax=Exilibacterium tricleocarpae TaxID=2591008 RepID=A0A545SXI9_9GAMM|nr:VOC family protein [Exilibacterium tricleocarpae]TQV69659.1 VOC family protein [Exilibacterium tricleocarpae]
MKPRISMIALAVSDLERATAFYAGGLGFPKMDAPPGVAFFNLNGTWLGLSERAALAADATVSAAGSGYNGFNLAHNVGSETQVDQVIEQAIAAGATLVKPAQRAAWGGYHGYFQDPDGHLWEVAYNPFFWIGPEDDSAQGREDTA